jgi:hypothetical protein
VKFFLHNLYAFEENGFQWEFRYDTISREEKPKEEDIYILNNKHS